MFYKFAHSRKRRNDVTLPVHSSDDITVYAPASAGKNTAKANQRIRVELKE